MLNQVRKRYLIGADFDETAFHTFSPSPNGMDVKRAYRLSLDDIFGENVGDWFFINIGLNNKTPSQVITDLLGREDGHKHRLMSNAWSFLEKQQGNFAALIPECADGSLSWNHDFPEITMTQMLVLQKLKYLMNEIGKQDKDGKMWPQPCKGFLEFMDVASQLKKEGTPLDTAIISSGHEAFIKRVFGVWNISLPDVLVTEDDIRPREYPQEQERRFKPGVFPLALAHRKWIKQQKVASTLEEAQASKNRIFYIGDDPHKDAQMAERSRIKVGLFPSTSWEEITNSLKRNRRLFDGRPIEKILTSAKNRAELEMHGHGNPERF